MLDGFQAVYSLSFSGLRLQGCRVSGGGLRGLRVEG